MNERIGGLTHNQRQRVIRLMKQLRDASVNFYMRLNDTSPQSLRSRTLSAKKMKECTSELYRTVKRT